MNHQLYLDILQRELIPALGCTEPIAVAYAAAKARQLLGCAPERIALCCSGNIIKNVKGVMVPNSGGLRGVEVAAILGVVGGDADSELEVLQSITDAHRAKTRELLAQGYCDTTLQEGVCNLYVKATVTAGDQSASVTILDRHTNITEMVKNGEVLCRQDVTFNTGAQSAEWEPTVEKIKQFAETVDVELLKPIIGPQIQMNQAIGRTGLNEPWGQQVGRTLLDSYPDSVVTRARAMAAAGSDARMGGCSMPVVINSGSGNQGITICNTVMEYVKEWNVGEEKMYRALALANLTSVHLKHYIGSLSAFCGAVTAAAAAGAAVTWLAGGSYEQIGMTVVNALGNGGGIVCDGAKGSCAAKISCAVEAALLGHHMAMKGRTFQPGEGLVLQDLEQTIRSIGHMGRVGMAQTDIEILNIMIDKTKV